MKQPSRAFTEAERRRLRERLAAKAEPSEAERAEHIQGVLAARAEKYALPARSEALAALRSVLGFQCGGERFAIECRYVLETGSRALTRVPGAPPHLLGLANLRGEILPVFDLLRALGRPGVDAAGEQLIVLGARGAEVGILAQALDGVTQLDERALRPPPNPAALPQAVVLGVTSDAVTLLDGKVLLDGPAFWLEAAPEPQNPSSR